jgi:hypothetical protein
MGELSPLTLSVSTDPISFSYTQEGYIPQPPHIYHVIEKRGGLQKIQSLGSTDISITSLNSMAWGHEKYFF